MKEGALTNQANRLALVEQVTNEELSRITLDDIATIAL
ncbi:MAG: hypothetical protein ACOX3V_01980 [Bacillota bacterium]|jgi:hypothetical protein